MRFDDSNLIGWIKFDKSARPEQLLRRGDHAESANRDNGRNRRATRLIEREDNRLIVDEVVTADVHQLREELYHEYRAVVLPTS